MAPSTRNEVFISYSHKDEKWLEKLRTMLKPMIRNKTISVWCDKDIQTGDKWRKEINDAIARAKVAVMLVSDHFLASDFIVEHELPPLLDAAENDGAIVFFIALSPCLVEETVLARYQAANNPDRPLDSLRSTSAQKADLASICRKLRDAIGKAPVVSPDADTGQLSQESATGNERHEAVTPASLPARRSLDTDLSDFTGRDEEVDRLIEALRKPGERAVIAAVIRGMGGMGKTALAVHVAYRLEDIYPDAQIQVNLQGDSERDPLTVAEAMTFVLRALEPEAQLPEDANQLTGVYHYVLGKTRALILLDNARSEQQVAGLITGPPCGFIVTSRDLRLVINDATAVNLDEMPPDQARELLRSIIGDSPTDMELDRVAEACARLPLALRMAGSYFATSTLYTPTTYAEIIKKERDALLREKHPDRDLSMRAVLGFSARRLIEENVIWAGRWQMLAVFTAPFDLEAAAAVWQTDSDAAQADLAELECRGLVQYQPESQRFSLHDLLRPIANNVFDHAALPNLRAIERARHGQDARQTAAQRRHATHYEAVLRKTRDLYMKGGDNIMAGLALADLEWNHILAGQAWAADHAGSDETATRLCNAYPDAGAYVLDLRLHQRERIKWLEAALVAARQLKDRQAEGNHLNNLGLAYSTLGETPRAIEYYEQALVIHRKIEINDRRGEGNALDNLGNAYAALREPPRAIEYYQQALVIRREIGDRRGESSNLYNLALALAKLGRREEASRLARESLAIMEAIEDPDVPKVRALLAILEAGPSA